VPIPGAVQEDGVRSLRSSAVCSTAFAVASFLFLCPTNWAQQAPSGSDADTTTAVHQLQDQVRELRTLVEQMRAENAESRAEMQQLRNDLKATRALLENPAPSDSQPAAAANESHPASATGVLPAASPGQETNAAAPSPATPPLEERVEKLEEATSLLGSKVDEQHQTKVETASKYRARLHGIVLMNAFRNVGSADNFDFPDFAEPVSASVSAASLGATMRQSEIGLEIFGPTVAGAKTSADVQLDFAGGFPATGNGVNFGIVRLQTANLHFDWEHTSVVAGQDSLFLSPLSPTSFASLANPAFAFAGNLWGWTPQIRVEQRFFLADQQTITVQAGLIDNLDWEYPSDSFYRAPQAGELSGQPAYGLRTSWSRPVHEHQMTFGAAGYFGRQSWPWDRYVDAWAGMADWQIPIVSRLTLSGEFYRGRGIGGLGAAEGRSIVYGGNPDYSATPIRGLDAEGGWTQLKFQLTPKVELNGTFAEDNAFAGDVRGFGTDADNYGTILGRNRGALGNIVFRPRSDLILSAEYRRLRSFPIFSGASSMNQVNLAAGILF
jgi:hypothetical protein